MAEAWIFDWQRTPRGRGKDTGALNVVRPVDLLAETLRARRADRLKGGLGLLRLVSENRFRLSARYEHEHLTVFAAFPLRGSV